MPGSALVGQQWFTTGQVGRLVGVSDDTIVRYIRQGCIRATKTPGGRFRIARKDLLAFQKKYGYTIEF